MNILESITTGFAAISKTLAEIKAAVVGKSDEALAKEVGELKTKVASQEQEIADLKSQIASGEEELKKANCDMNSAFASLAERDALIAKLASEAKTAGQRAAEMLAAQGVPAGSLPSPGAAGNDQIATLRKQLAEATDPEQKYTLSMQIRALAAKKQQQ